MVSPVQHCLQFFRWIAILFAVMVGLSACEDKRIPLHLGESIVDCTATYGSGRLNGYGGPHKMSFVYENAPDKAEVRFYDGVAVSIAYRVTGSSPEDKELRRYLILNAQGHQWSLTTNTSVPSGSGFWKTSHQFTWKRDDGVTATYVERASTLEIYSATDEAK